MELKIKAWSLADFHNVFAVFEDENGKEFGKNFKRLGWIYRFCHKYTFDDMTILCRFLEFCNNNF